MIGILGEYPGRVYDEVKRRPLYLVDGTQNFTARAEGGHALPACADSTAQG